MPACAGFRSLRWPPIYVHWGGARGVEVALAGERRWGAAKMAVLLELQCVIHDDVLSSDERLAMQLVENAFRDDLKPVEKARTYKKLMSAKGWSMTELAAELGVHETSINRALALLELRCTVQDQVEQGALTPLTAAEIAKFADPEYQHAIADEAIASGLKRAEVAAAAQAVRANRPALQARPGPILLDLGDGIMITIHWREATGVTATQLLRKTLKILQHRERDDPAAWLVKRERKGARRPGTGPMIPTGSRITAQIWRQGQGPGIGFNVPGSRR